MLEDRTIVDERYTESEIISMTGSAELSSEHPLARAIVDSAREKGLQLRQPESFEAERGRGITARLDGREIKVGNREFMIAGDIDTEAHAQAITEPSSQGKTVL